MTERLKRLDEYTPEDHLNRIRKGSERNPNPMRGRAPRVNDPNSAPSHDELVEAGLARPRPATATPGEQIYKNTADAVEKVLEHSPRRFANRINQLKTELDFEMRQMYDGGGNSVRKARVDALQRQIGKLERDLRNAQATPPRRDRPSEAPEIVVPPGRFDPSAETGEDWRFDERGRPVEKLGRRLDVSEPEAA